jgi:hypothetical protein
MIPDNIEQLAAELEVTVDYYLAEFFTQLHQEDYNDCTYYW